MKTITDPNTQKTVVPKLLQTSCGNCYIFEYAGLEVELSADKCRLTLTDPETVASEYWQRNDVSSPWALVGADKMLTDGWPDSYHNDIDVLTR